ncbi:MAG: radical SAM protein, partial [Thermoplasmatota archaeon]
MKTTTQWLKNSQYISSLSQGCKQCAQGSKLVLLITGLCPASCFYCPLSFKKKGNDVIYANEWKLKNENDAEIILKEAALMNAQGAGITGGDPLSVWKRTIRYIHLLKNHYGEHFHIHLYTSGLVHQEHIREVIDAGLDEIRFHPLPQTWMNMQKNPVNKAITAAVQTNAKIAIEIPAIPGMKKEIIHLIKWAEKQHIDYINLNELEFSEQNENALYQKGFTTKNDLSA